MDFFAKPVPPVTYNGCNTVNNTTQHNTIYSMAGGFSIRLFDWKQKAKIN